MNRTQLEHIIRAASQISGDAEIVVVGSQAIHAQPMKLPPIAFQSDEADVYPRNNPERAEDIDAAMGELSPFHDTHGYYGHGVGPTTAILPHGWEQRVAGCPTRTRAARPGFAWMFTTSPCPSMRRGGRKTSNSTASLPGMVSSASGSSSGPYRRCH